jgi:AraC family transcriptional regulator
MRILLDQPDLLTPSRSRRLAYSVDNPQRTVDGEREQDRIAILNARGARFDGGADESDLSLKWIPQGEAEYASGRIRFLLKGAAQLLLNRGQSYRLAMRAPSESFVLFFSRALADEAWAAHSGRAESFPEAPTVAGHSPRPLQAPLAELRDESKAAAPSPERLEELALAILAEIAALAGLRRRMSRAIPALRGSTREELLRRVARAESYLIETRGASLAGASDAAALSPFHLIRMFRAAYGETPLAWAAGRRLESARDALILTGDGIEAIARRAGYESRNAFDRAFCRRFGDTPGAVRDGR